MDMDIDDGFGSRGRPRHGRRHIGLRFPYSPLFPK
jgi:hypothetical protein